MASFNVSILFETPPNILIERGFTDLDQYRYEDSDVDLMVDLFVEE